MPKHFVIFVSVIFFFTFFHIVCLSVSLEIRSQYLAHGDLKLVILLLLPPKCGDVFTFLMIHI
jgi:hypothetical protein